MNPLAALAHLLGGAAGAVGGAVNAINPFHAQAALAPSEGGNNRPLIGTPQATTLGGPSWAVRGALQRMQPIQQIQAMPRMMRVNAQSQPQWNPSMGGPAIGGPNFSSPIPSFMGNRYANNPTSPEFNGVDPMIFGYPPDGPQPSIQPTLNRINTATGFDKLLGR